MSRRPAQSYVPRVPATGKSDTPARSLPGMTAPSGMTEGWDPKKRVLVALGAMLAVELLERALGLRRRAAQALTVRLYDFDHTSRQGMHRAEISMFMAGLTGAARRR